MLDQSFPRVEGEGKEEYHRDPSDPYRVLNEKDRCEPCHQGAYPYDRNKEYPF